MAPSSSGSPPPQQLHTYGREYPTACGHELEVFENAGEGVHIGRVGLGCTISSNSSRGSRGRIMGMPNHKNTTSRQGMEGDDSRRNRRMTSPKG